MTRLWARYPCDKASIRAGPPWFDEAGVSLSAIDTLPVLIASSTQMGETAERAMLGSRNTRDPSCRSSRRFSTNSGSSSRKGAVAAIKLIAIARKRRSFSLKCPSRAQNVSIPRHLPIALSTHRGQKTHIFLSGNGSKKCKCLSPRARTSGSSLLRHLQYLQHPAPPPLPRHDHSNVAKVLISLARS